MLRAESFFFFPILCRVCRIIFPESDNITCISYYVYDPTNSFIGCFGMIAIYERFSLLINLILFVKITSTGKSKADCQILFELVVVFSEVVAATIL